MHIVTGTVGLITMWVPIVGRKGGSAHKRWGKIFAQALLYTGVIAIGISLVTLRYPLETHPFSDDAPLVRGLFGWMMLYLATLTIMLSRYGMWCIANRRNHAQNKTPLNLALQAATFITAANCAWHGYQLEQSLMMGIAVVGLLAALLNTRFIFQKKPPLNEWLIQHTRGLVGAGISVYTAFFAFGAVNLMPQLAFNPVLWATPTTLGVALLLYHQFKIYIQRRARALSAASG
ncbi:MAG: hypothetical protein KTR32_12990 [Granulosicoccus sp.]|nr:hypothetical protein [Granulosicoccus sp.]